MGIGGENMYSLAFKQPLGGAARALAPESSQRRSGHLNDAALLGPLHHALQVLAQNRVTLRMRDDDGDSAIPEFVEGIRRVLRYAVIAELHEQVVGFADDVARGIGERVLQILV